jgi:hypothetical protein
MLRREKNKKGTKTISVCPDDSFADMLDGPLPAG